MPQRAVTELQGGYQVAVVGSENKIDIRPVKVAERVDNLWVIDEGLKPGERVMAEGVQKIKQGMVVNPKPFRTESKIKPEVACRSRQRKSASAGQDREEVDPPCQSSL